MVSEGKLVTNGKYFLFGTKPAIEPMFIHNPSSNLLAHRGKDCESTGKGGCRLGKR
jgi:hypothetical protein